MSCCHPGIAQWAGQKPILVIMNRVDMISEADRATWSSYFAQQGRHVIWTNASSGTGILQVSTVPRCAFLMHRPHESQLLHAKRQALSQHRRAGHPDNSAWPVQISKAADEVGALLNTARTKRGLQARAVRAAVIGFPNVGKSALINRLVGRRAARSAPKPGVTRQLAWVRLGGAVDLLDTPGALRP